MAHIHIFSGLGSSVIRPFQRGTRSIEELIDNLPSDIDAKHHIWSSWSRVADQILSTHRGDPVILVGHSNGVLAACNVAERLNRHGIQVSYIGAIDPTAAKFARIDHNVHTVEEFWAASGYPKIKRWLTNNRRAACVFVDDWQGEHNRFTLKATHIGIATHEYVQERIFDQIQKRI